jgi:16S rRNA (guanine527-N7)-methyltransferase
VEHIIQTHNFEHYDLADELLQKYSDEIREYVDQLLWWNERVNLISRDVSRETVVEHVRHSLMINSSGLFKSADNIIDAGTGGGLPGIPLALVNRDKTVVLNDVVSKKIMACKQMILKAGLSNCLTNNGSIADVEIDESTCIVTKHAFKINDLMTMIGERPWLGIIMLKGAEEVDQEMEGVSESLRINVFKLDQSANPFYNGKALIEITRL